ncbi:50S ribosomal protein L3 [candidate division Kazan bacterium RIFCSPHIGHO2_01_FULL_44_14]|uniref:50S ribosomal protein L3 n=1 Tax=candidate division Kazan bacterium RIFCSPLOWO2_01_FULL_45_19 TaxID=1798538 RepID=A0A1F4NPN0_UNCK3|nr:hypothetical protein [uncultured bacterium]OGB73413.1 MAG: 50S ribosomal protein L3 [candidate division Kazan bacterium RIFCSPLOWO2_01_FULL_45_19]OGB77658.1 MAG: 50S ribosomal protein L3 [candidate division Kazan bacterium RIFCSPHIGHO2_01_FULL_44_14]
MSGMFVTKLLMTQAITEDGKARAITIMKAEPNVITQIKLPEKDGYFAIQLGLPNAKAKPTKAGIPVMRRKGEFKYSEGEYKVGDKITAELFAIGDTVRAVGISKGKGFAGTVKRHGFSRGPMTHGHDHHRAPGSIGPMGMAKVAKGMRMAGHMGVSRVTVRNLKIVAVDAKNQLLAVTGAVPGHTKSIFMLQKNG